MSHVFCCEANNITHWCYKNYAVLNFCHREITLVQVMYHYIYDKEDWWAFGHWNIITSQTCFCRSDCEEEIIHQVREHVSRGSNYHVLLKIKAKLGYENVFRILYDNLDIKVSPTGHVINWGPRCKILHKEWKTMCFKPKPVLTPVTSAGGHLGSKSLSDTITLHLEHVRAVN